MMEFNLRPNTEFIDLLQLLKATHLANSGGEAKALVESEKVRVNGELELRKRRKLRVGDKVQVLGQEIEIR